MENPREIQFRVERIGDGENERQVEQFVEMMGRMYDYHARLHPDWKPKADWQKGSAGWIKNAGGKGGWYFALAYPKNKAQLAKPAGYIIAGFHHEAPLFIRNRYGYIADIWCEPEFRGQGAAEVLLEAALEFLRSQEVERVQLEVMVNNEPGKRFWQKSGFEPFEIVMRKDI